MKLKCALGVQKFCSMESYLCARFSDLNAFLLILETTWYLPLVPMTPVVLSLVQ